MAYDDKFPIRCPMCDKKTAMLGFTCNGCGTIYEDTHQAYFKCPKCHGKKVEQQLSTVYAVTSKKS